MAIRKPPKIAPVMDSAAPSKARRTLMSNQDTRRKGDTYGRDRVQMTFWVTPERKAEIKAYAADHEMTVSRLIVEALESKMRE